MSPLLSYNGRIAIRAQCPKLSTRIKFDGLWLGAGIDREESSQTGFQLTLRAAQDEAVSTGRQEGYHSYRAKGTIASTLTVWIFPEQRSTVKKKNKCMVNEKMMVLLTLRWTTGFVIPAHITNPSRNPSRPVFSKSMARGVGVLPAHEERTV